MFMIRPTPLPGESLSSWRQRCGLRNGFRLFPPAPGESRRVDVDLNPGTRTSEWLAAQFMLTHGAISGMTLKQLDGKVLLFGSGRATPRWVIPVRYSRRDHAFGVPFCPLCLRDDRVPYIRLRWRLAFTSACPIHRVGLLDRCPDCGHPAWPGSIACPTLFMRTWTPPHVCLLCGFDLRSSPPTSSEAEIKIRMSGELFENDVTLGDKQVVGALGYASAVWSVAQLFVRRRSQGLVQAGSAVMAALVDDVRQVPAARSIEDLPIGVRGGVVEQAHALFEEWPSTLLDFCGRCDLSAEHFSVDRSTIPDWFEAMARRAIRRQVRGVSRQQVDEACQQLERAGEGVSKAAVAKLLGTKYVNAVDEVLGRRLDASGSELADLLKRLAQWPLVDVLRESSVEVRLRDVGMILLSVVCRLDLNPVANTGVQRTQQRLVDLLHEARSSEIRARAIQQLEAVMHAYETQRSRPSSKRSELNQWRTFVPFRGNNGCAKSAQRTLGRCMLGMDPRLHKSVRSFFSSAA